MYAVFVDEGLDALFDHESEAKRYAANLRQRLKMQGRKIPCRVHKMAKEKEKFFGPVDV